MIGSAPASENEWKRARGVRPRAAARSSLMISTADAPSVIWLELPAVTTPSSLKAGLSPASFSAVVPGRMPSSADTVLAGLDHLVRLAVEATLGHGHDLPLEATLGGGLLGAVLAERAERVELLARQVPLLGDELGRDALGHEAADGLVALHHRGAERRADVLHHHRRAHRHEAHDLDTRGDDDVVRAGDHALRGEVGRLLRRAALPVDRRSGHGLRPARGEHGVAPDVGALRADLHDATHDHVVDDAGVDARALGQRLERLGREVDGMPTRETTVALARAVCGRHRR